MNSAHRIVVLAAVAALATACQPAAPAGLAAADKAAIIAAGDAALKIGNTTPLDAGAYVKAYYADDAEFMIPNDKTLKGAAAIEGWLKALPPVSSLKFTDRVIEGVGDAAYVRGNYSFTLNPPGAAPMTDTGKFLEIWKKRADGSWRNVLDAFNSDLPAAPPPPAPAKKK